MIHKIFVLLYFLFQPNDPVYDVIKQPPIRVTPPGVLNYQKKLEENPIPLQTLQGAQLKNKETGVENHDAEVLIDIGEGEENETATNVVKSKDKTDPIDSGFAGSTEDSFNQTMVYNGQNYNYAQLSSSMQPSAPSPSFVASPQFSSTLNPFQHSSKTPRSPEESLNPFMHSNKTLRSPEESAFQGYCSLQVSFLCKTLPVS